MIRKGHNAPIETLHDSKRSCVTSGLSTSRAPLALVIPVAIHVETTRIFDDDIPIAELHLSVSSSACQSPEQLTIPPPVDPSSRIDFNKGKAPQSPT